MSSKLEIVSIENYMMDSGIRAENFGTQSKKSLLLFKLKELVYHLPEDEMNHLIQYLELMKLKHTPKKELDQKNDQKKINKNDFNKEIINKN